MARAASSIDGRWRLIRAKVNGKAVVGWAKRSVPNNPSQFARGDGYRLKQDENLLAVRPQSVETRKICRYA